MGTCSKLQGAKGQEHRTTHASTSERRSGSQHCQTTHIEQLKHIQCYMFVMRETARVDNKNTAQNENTVVAVPFTGIGA